MQAKLTRIRAQIRHLSTLGLPAETLLPQLFPLIRKLVPADSAGFFWVDSSGHMQNLVAERMLSVPKMRLYFERYYEGGAFDFRESFQQRAQSTDVVAISEDSDAFKQSAYYNEILKELDAHRVLYGIVRDQGQALGQLSLYRSKDAKPFSRGEKEALASVMHYVGHAVAAPVQLALQNSSGLEYRDSSDDAVLVVAPDGSVVHGSELAQRLAVQAAGGKFARNFVGIEAPEVKHLLRDAVTMLERSEAPLLSRDTAWGRIQLRVYRLAEMRAGGKTLAPVAIRITRQEPMVLQFARSLQSLDISAQQREVAMLIGRGFANPQIAETMGLSVNTIAYHIKQLFQRLEAHGRAELIERVINLSKSA